MDKEIYSKKHIKPLIPLKKCFKKKVIGFDIETHGRKNKFVLACFWCDDTSLQRKFRSVEEMKHWLDNDKALRNCMFVATNLAFDFLGSFMDDHEHYKLSERSGHLYSATFYQYKDRKKPLKFYDTINFHKASVETLGNLIGIPKMEHPSCFAKLPKNELEWEELFLYCMNDAKVSAEFFNKIIVPFIDKFNSRLKCTIASESLEIFRRKYLKGIYRVCSAEMHTLIRKAYYGGRTETFRRGEYSNVTCYDINSLYPWCLLKEYPDPNTAIYMEELNEKAIYRYEGVCYIEGVQEYRFIPPLPFRNDDGKLLFPVGEIKGHYTFVELRHALKNGLKINSYGEGVLYTKTCSPFKEFIKDIYKKRQELQKEGNPLEIMYKLVMNSLYGKWAFNYQLKHELIHMSELSQDQIRECDNFTVYGDYAELITDGGHEPTIYSFPIWSAYTTSYARIRLYDYLTMNEEKLLYCDTDSVFFKNGYTLENTSKELGDMKIEKGYPVDKAIFVRPKFYSTGMKAKIKGVRTVKTRAEFLRLLEKPELCEERFVKFRTAAKSKDSHKYGKLTINEIIKVNKKMDLQDSKRVWKGKFSTKQETSIPINLIDGVPEYKYEVDREKAELKMAKLMDLTKDSDFFDKKGEDISKEEYFKNEIDSPL